ncbi:MAG TPA: nucleotidyltransferase family protein [Pyrinomonadaceae bacterium]|nr:nucleotidyltransferase family protein [Pyrinomonadaceae bacterium]
MASNDSPELEISAVGGPFRWGMLQKRSQRVSAASAIGTFHRNGIESIVIKGIAVARYYPADQWRKFTDIDLAVSGSDFDRAEAVKIEASNSFQPVDLHRELRHLDTVPWADLFEHSTLETIEGTDIRFLCPEDHLRVICAHWLTDGGAYKHRLWDIYWSVQNRPKDFDWDRCLNIVSPNRRKWVIYTIGLANRYLDLRIDDLPFVDEARELPKWLIRSLEREWRSTTRLQPLVLFTRDPFGLFRQILKRLPPNAIQATIDMDGSLDARTRLHYQIGDIYTRFVRAVRLRFHR